MHPPLPDVLPVFPLPGLVLFPGTQLPLHIFEPRYREMLEAALSGDRMLVMALLQPGWEEQYYGAPPLHTTGCAARIVTAQKVPDGRSNITVMGVARVRLGDELPGLPYRRVRVQPLPDRRDWLATPEAIASVPKLLRLFGAIQEEQKVTTGPDWKPEPPALETAVNMMAMFFPGEPALRQELLEIDDVGARFKRLEELVIEVTRRRDLLGRWSAVRPDDPELN